jgi:hypothetical protein
MPDKPPRKRPELGGFAGFAALDPISIGRRKPRWSLRPTGEEHGSQAVDAARFIKEDQVLQGLGRKP